MWHAFTLYRFLNLNVPKTFVFNGSGLERAAGTKNSLSGDASADLFKLKVWIKTRDSGPPPNVSNTKMFFFHVIFYKDKWLRAAVDHQTA